MSTTEDSFLKTSDNFTMFEAEWTCRNSEGIDESIDGIFGFARPNKTMMIFPDRTPEDKGQFFLQNYKVHNDACDDCYSFSTNFVDFQSTSFIDFGTPPSGTVTDEVKLEVYDDFYWSMGMGAIRIGEDDEFAATFSYDDQALLDEKNQLYTILDTSASDIYISDLYFSSFLDNFFAAHGIKNKNCYSRRIVSECPKTDFKSIYFLMGEHWIEVLPEHYVDKVDGECVYKFRGVWAPFNILGMPAFLDYYVTHVWSESDDIPSYVSFAKAQNSDKKELP